MRLLQRRTDVIVALLTFFFLRELRVRALEPFDRVVVVVLAKESEAGLIERLRAIGALREPLDYVQEMRASFGPVTVKQVNSHATQAIELLWLGPGRPVQSIQAKRCRQCVIVARRGD